VTTGKRRKDYLHKERKECEQRMRQNSFSKDQMDQRDCKSPAEEKQRVHDYMQRQAAGNDRDQRRFADINREFKKNGDEGEVRTNDDARKRRSIKYQ